MRLDELAAGDPEVTVVWRSFLLRPEPEDRPLDAFVEYTAGWARPAALEPRARFATPWQGGSPPSHSFPAALAAKVAETFGPGPAAAYRASVFDAYFAEHRTVSHRSVLVDLAGRAGVDPEAFDRRWAEREDDLLHAVYADHVTAVRSGISAVPAVVVDRRYLIPGAVEVDEYRAVIDRARTGGDDPHGG